LYSAERHAKEHQTNLNEGWKASNNNLNSQPQVITSQRCILCFEIRGLNLQTLIQCWVNRAAARKVLHSGVELTAPLISPSYAKPEVMGPQNCHAGKYLDAMIKDFGVILDNMQYSMHHVLIYYGMRVFINHKSCNETYI